MTLPETSLLILAGGESKRMGEPKHLLPVFGETMINYILNRIGVMFSEVLLAGRDLEQVPSGVVPVEDVRTERCPLVGILSGMRAAGNRRVFVLGCDMPFIVPGLVRMLCSREQGSADVIVPVVGGYYEPLCAVYSRSVSEEIARYIDSGRSKTTGFFQSVKVDEVPEVSIREFDPLLESFVNLNTPRDYRNHFTS